MITLQTEWGPMAAQFRGALDGRRPVMLLLHGGHGGWQHWSANLDALSQRFDLVAPDMPGFGDSCDVPEGTGLEALARAILRALPPAAQTPALVVAFSFGTLVALTLARMSQGRGAWPKCLILVNPPLGKAVSSEVLSIISRAGEAARSGGLEAGVAVTQSEIMLADPARVTPDMIANAAQMVRATRFASRPISRALDVRDLLSGLQVPCHVLLGERDPHQRASLQERVPQYEALLGAGHVHRVPGAAHWLQFDQADAFHALVERITADLR